MSIYIPLFQTLVWPVFIAGLVFLFRGVFVTMLEAVAANLSKGAPVVVGPSGVSIGTPPPEIKNTGQTVGVTAEGTRGAGKSQSIVDALQAAGLPAGIVDSLYLVHASQVVRPRSAHMAGLYRVRVSLESDSTDELGAVKRVTYRLHSTFPSRIIATEARDKNFELWLNVYGEFTIVAVLEREGQPSVWLTRYLDLPGRPPE